MANLGLKGAIVMSGMRTIGFLALTVLASLGGAPQAAAQEEGKLVGLLQNAHQHEIGAWVKYGVFERVAEEEGLPEYAIFFRALQYAEEVHRKRFATHLHECSATPMVFVEHFSFGGTQENLHTAIQTEHEEWLSIYPAIREQVATGRFRDVDASLWYAESAECTHERGCQRALDGLRKSNPGPHPVPVYVCSGCGSLWFEAPSRSCPKCRNGHEGFRCFDNESVASR